MAQLVVVFGLGEDRFAVPATEIREIVRLVALSPIPGAREGVRGAMNLRGTMVPVADLRVLLRREAVDGADTPILLVEAAGSLVGLIADRVYDVEAVEEGRVQEVPAGAGLPSFVVGVRAGDDGMLYIVDPVAMAQGFQLEGD